MNKEETMLQAPTTRRTILRTSAKVAVATPIVLASLEAVPAFAGGNPGNPVTADASEDPPEDTELHNLTAIGSTFLPATPANIAAVQNQLTQFLNSFKALAASVVVPSSWSSTDIWSSGPGGYATTYTYNSWTFNGNIVPGNTNTLPSTTVTTVQDAMNYLSLLIQTAINAVGALSNPPTSSQQDDVTNISRIINSSPPPIPTKSSAGVEADFENGLIALSGNAFG